MTQNKSGHPPPRVWIHFNEQDGHDASPDVFLKPCGPIPYQAGLKNYLSLAEHESEKEQWRLREERLKALLDRAVGALEEIYARIGAIKTSEWQGSSLPFIDAMWESLDLSRNVLAEIRAQQEKESE